MSKCICIFTQGMFKRYIMRMYKLSEYQGVTQWLCKVTWRVCNKREGLHHECVIKTYLHATISPTIFTITQSLFNSLHITHLIMTSPIIPLAYLLGEILDGQTSINVTWRTMSCQFQSRIYSSWYALTRSVKISGLMISTTYIFFYSAYLLLMKIK